MESLTGLLAAARAAQGRARLTAVERWHAALARTRFCPEGPQRRAVADFLLAELAEGGLGVLRDGRGHTSRAVAAGALLELGFPYALEIAPEDLEYLRESERPRSTRRRAAVALLALLASTSGGVLATSPGAHGWVLLAALIAGLAVEASLGRGRGERILQVRLLTLTSALLCGVGALFEPGMGVALLGPLVVALLLARPSARG